MDAETRRDLGGLVLGAVALLLGLAVRASGTTYAADAIGAALLLGGVIVVAILGIRIGTRLARS